VEPMGRLRTLSEVERRKGQEKGRSNLQILMAEACAQVMQEIRENPPHLICWLRGGVNLQRANEIREELEKRS
jgi:hypothetical protein